MPIIVHPEQRRLTLFASVAMFVLAGVMTGLSASLVDIARAFGIAPTRAGMLYSVHFAGFMVFVAFSAFAVGLRLRLRVTRLAAVLYVPALTAVALSGNVVLLAAALFIAGGSGGLLESQTATIQVMTSRNESEAGILISITQMFFAVGALVIPVYFSITAGVSIGSETLWRPLFGGLAAIAAVSAMAGTRVRAERFDAPERQNGALDMRALTRTALGLAFYVGAEVTLFGWAPTVMEYYRGIPAFRARISPSVFWIGMLAGRMIVARLSVRYFPSALLRLSTVLGIIGTVLLCFASAEWLLWVAIILTAHATAM